MSIDFLREQRLLFLADGGLILAANVPVSVRSVKWLWLLLR